MPYQMHVIKTSDFVRLDARGRPDLTQTAHALEGLAKACVDSGANRALLDIRDARSDMSLTDLYNLISAFPAMGFRNAHRLAVLHRLTDGAKAEFFALCASTRGWNVRAFGMFEEAIEWFSTDLPSPE